MTADQTGHYCLECRTPYRPEDVVRILTSDGKSTGVIPLYLCRWHHNRRQEARAAA